MYSKFENRPILTLLILILTLVESVFSLRLQAIKHDPEAQSGDASIASSLNPLTIQNPKNFESKKIIFSQNNKNITSNGDLAIDFNHLYRALNFTATVYCPADELVPFYICNPICEEIKDFKVYKYIQGQKNVASYVGYSEQTKYIWISFRGTQGASIQNWISDISFFRTTLDPEKVPGAEVHGGFFSAYHVLGHADEIVSCLLDLMKIHPDYKIGITGHSLGGALGTICATDLFLNHDITFDSFVSFGQPRVGNSVFVEWWQKTFGHRNVRRITHSSDIVVHLPYVHMGFEHFGPELWQSSDDLSTIVVCENGEDTNCAGGVYPTVFYALYEHLHYLDKFIGTDACIASSTVNTIDITKLNKTEFQTYKESFGLHQTPQYSTLSVVKH